MRKAINTRDNRSAELILEHYHVEKRLANILRNSTKESRSRLYGKLYNELFRSVPHHPQLIRKISKKDHQKKIDQKLKLICKIASDHYTFLEIGAGDCALSIEMAKRLKQVYAIEVSEEITPKEKVSDNFEVIITNGTEIPLQPGSIDLAYSNQLIEHLHPDDVHEKLSSVYQCLKKDGKYLLVTPNRLNGPHDVSKYFDDEATGFHLKEYTYTDLIRLHKEVGFTRFEAYMGGKGIYFKLPVSFITTVESMMSRLSYSMRKKIGSLLPVAAILNINFVAIK